MDITGIVEAAAVLIAAIITGFIVPYIKGKISAENQRQICKWVKIAVAAAEQIFTASGMGAKKKGFVLDFLQDHGFKVNEDSLNALIEAAVYELKNGLIPAVIGGITDEP